jgi:hypothetical protein
MKTKRIFLLVTAAVFAAGCADMSARITKTSAEALAAGRRHDGAAINKLAASITSSDLSQDHLRNYSSDTTATLFGTLRTISFYIPDNADYASRLGVVFKEKVRRKEYNDEDISQVHKAYLMSGLFEEAAALAKEFHDKSLQSIPEILPAGNSPSPGWQAYKISDDGKKAWLEFLAKDGPRVIMVIRPACEFAEMAAKAILTDKELGPVFRSNGFMLTRVFDPSGVNALKTEFNFKAIYIARKSTDFPDFALLRISPTFYFLKDGKTLHTFAGWSNEDDGAYAKSEIHKGLAAIGLEEAGKI